MGKHVVFLRPLGLRLVMTHETVKENEQYKLTIHVDAEWLRDENTAYPIRIDPTVYVDTSDEDYPRYENAIEDVTIYSSKTATGLESGLYVGYRSGYGKARVLMQFPGIALADIPSSTHLRSASLHIHDETQTTDPLKVSCYFFTGNTWEEADATWNDVNGDSFTHYMSQETISTWRGNVYTPQHTYVFSILDYIKYCKDGKASVEKGIMLKATAEVENAAEDNYKRFTSFNSTESTRPYVTITYDDTTGAYSPPFGWFDSVTSTAAKGWAWCVDTPNDPVTIKVYLTNTTTGHAYAPLVTTADVPRPDVAAAGYGTGNYGFVCPIDWNQFTPGRYSVSVYAIGRNGATTLLKSDPKYYQNEIYTQILDNGEYYINNKEFGGYLKKNASTLGAESGTLAYHGNDIKWTLTKQSNGYTISNSSMYLATTSSHTAGTPILLSSTEGLTYQHIWDMVLVGGVYLRNRYNGMYLCLSGDGLCLDETVGTIGSTLNRQHIWRIVSTSEYGGAHTNVYSELNNSFSIKYLALNKDEALTPEVKKYPINALWSNSEDFEFSKDETVDNVTIDNNTHTIKGVKSGCVKVAGKHKVTGRVVEFDVFVCKYILYLNNYYDNSYLVYYNRTASESYRDIKEITDYVNKYYAKNFLLKIVSNDPAYYQTHLDKCKDNVTIENLDDMCSHICEGSYPERSDDDFLYSSSNGLLNEFNAAHGGGGNTVDVLWSCHKISPLDGFLSTNENGEEINYNRSFSYSSKNDDRVIIERNILIIDKFEKPRSSYVQFSDYEYDRIEFLRNILFHEVCHVFGAEDHYHEISKETYYGCQNPECCNSTDGCQKPNCCGNPICCEAEIQCCGNPGCIDCHDLSNYNELCKMRNPSVAAEFLCMGCIEKIQSCLENTHYFKPEV